MTKTGTGSRRPRRYLGTEYSKFQINTRARTLQSEDLVESLDEVCVTFLILGLQPSIHLKICLQ